MSDQAFTTKPKRVAKVSITVNELVDAVCEYLGEKFGITVNKIGLDYPEDFTERTKVILHDIMSDDAAWKNYAINFFIDGLRTQSGRARLGGEVRPFVIWKQRMWEESTKWQKIAEVAAQPNRDRTITFYPIDHWEGATAFFKRPPATK